VLGRVVGLDDIAARVELYPGACTGLSANEVTGNPLDRLTTLMSVGEVLPVRVIARGGHNGQGWRLSTLDVEDSEAILPSPSLLPDGPPWLVRAESGPDLAPVPPGTERVEQTGRLEASTRRQLAQSSLERGLHPRWRQGPSPRPPLAPSRCFGRSRGSRDS